MERVLREHHLDAPLQGGRRHRQPGSSPERLAHAGERALVPEISSNRDIQPYIGANVGGYIIERYLAVGITASQETHFHFGLAPEIGVFFQNPVGAVFLNARYNMAFAAGGVPFQQFLSFSLGYAWER